VTNADFGAFKQQQKNNEVTEIIIAQTVLQMQQNNP
jgi:hypothetical protein